MADETSKPFWQSKTLWANVVAFAVTALNSSFGWADVSGEETAGILVLLNLILRLVTKGSVTLS